MKIQRPIGPSVLNNACLLCVLIAMGSGCANWRAGQGKAYRDQVTGITVKHGRDAPVIDAIGWVAGTPNKLALWDRRADNHDIAPETVGGVLRYMNANSLNDVQVNVNRYDPLDEWGRLIANQRVGPGWKYTVGLYAHLKYTLLPGRVVGGDWYNPYTDSLHLYSDIVPLGIARVAYAKDVRTRDYAGTYAASQEIPIVGMMHEALATEDALYYLRNYETQEQIEEAERILAPDYGASWGGQVASFLPYGATIGRLIGASFGHASNAFKDSCDASSAPSKTSFRPLERPVYESNPWLR